MMRILRTSLATVFVLLSLANSSKIKFDENDLKQLQKALHESAQYMRKEVKDEHVSICIGATRAGKSTLINYLIGNKLKAVRHSRINPITIEKIDSQSIGPEIGRGSTSKTTIPTKWVSKNFTDIIIWDAPGFDDNRGPVQDITNAFYLYQLVQNVKSLKIILAVDINDILHDNIRPFLSVLNAVENLLGDKMKDHFTSISLIFTKVPNTLDDVPVDMEFINAKLEFQFLNSSDMQLSQISKEFVNFLISNNNQIGLFKRPVTANVITSAVVDVNIFAAIKNSSSLQKNQLQQLSPSISDSSKLCLYECRENLYSTSVFDELGKTISVITKRKVETNTSIVNDKAEAENKLKQLNKELTEIKDLFDVILSENNFLKQMEILGTIDSDIKNKIEEHKMLEKISLMEFVDKLLGLEEGKILANKLQEILTDSHYIIKNGILSNSEKLGEITKQKQDELIKKEREEYKRKKDELEKIRKQMIKDNEERKRFWGKLLTAAIGILVVATGGMALG